MTGFLDIPHLRRFGWTRIHGAVPVRLCDRLVEVLEAEMDVPVHDESRWHEYGGEPRDFIPIWGHQASGTSDSILICTAFGRRSGRPNG